MSAIADIDGDRACLTGQTSLLSSLGLRLPLISVYANETHARYASNGQGKPQAKNSSGSGANWYLGTEAESLSAGLKVNSRTMFEGTVAPTDMGMQACFFRWQAPVSPAMFSGNEKLCFEASGEPMSACANWQQGSGRIGIFGTGNAYAGSSGRVTSERIGRDLNPLGRGDGNAYVGGAMNYGRIAPRLPGSYGGGGWGNSVNNGCNGCGFTQNENKPPGDIRIPGGTVPGPTGTEVHECQSAVNKPETATAGICCIKCCDSRGWDFGDINDADDHGQYIMCQGIVVNTMSGTCKGTCCLYMPVYGAVEVRVTMFNKSGDQIKCKECFTIKIYKEACENADSFMPGTLDPRPKVHCWFEDTTDEDQRTGCKGKLPNELFTATSTWREFEQTSNYQNAIANHVAGCEFKDADGKPILNGDPARPPKNPNHEAFNVDCDPKTTGEGVNGDPGLPVLPEPEPAPVPDLEFGHHQEHTSIN